MAGQAISRYGRIAGGESIMDGYAPESAGIYRIEIQSDDGKARAYVGQAANLRRRRKDHFVRLRNGTHTNLRMLRCFSKYGEQAFHFATVLVCPPDRDLLAKYEKAVLDVEVERRGSDAVLNVQRIDMKTMLGVRKSEESKARHSMAMKGRPRTASQIEAVRLSNKTRIVSAETRKKHSAIMMGNKHALGHVQTDEHKRKSTRHFVGKSKPAEQVAKTADTRRIRAEARGYWQPPEAIAKMRKALTGRKLSPEHRQKIAASGIGRHPSDETRIRLSLAQKARRDRERAERGQNGRD